MRSADGIFALQGHPIMLHEHADHGCKYEDTDILLDETDLLPAAHA